MYSYGKAYSGIMQNKCIFLKDPFQSTAYRCSEVRLCILNFHVKKKIREKILLCQHFLLFPQVTGSADAQDTSAEAGECLHYSFCSLLPLL